MKDEDINSKKGSEKLINLVKEHFDGATELSMRNMERIISSYNENLNLALNFNKKFAENINDQLVSLFKLQKKSFDTLFGHDIYPEWWKATANEKV
jgi:hypothetical protein